MNAEAVLKELLVAEQLFLKVIDGRAVITADDDPDGTVIGTTSWPVARPDMTGRCGRRRDVLRRLCIRCN